MIKNSIPKRFRILYAVLLLLGFIPLGNPAIYGGDAIIDSEFALERAGFKAPSFLTGFTVFGFNLHLGSRVFFRKAVLSRKKFVMIRSRSLQYQISTTATTVGDVLHEQKLDSRFADNSQEMVQSGMTIEIRKPVSVTIFDGASRTAFVTAASTIGDLLAEEKIPLSAVDEVSPNLASFLGEGMKVRINRIVNIPETQIVGIDYKVKLINAPELYYGTEVVVIPGVEGRREQEYLVTYKNGVEVKRRLLAKKILANPKTETRKFGIKIEIEEVQEGRASWYGYQDCLCAAHPAFPKGRFVRVTDLVTQKSIFVKINDRGPDQGIFPERVIDLDKVAFRKLGSLQHGTRRVRVELLKYDSSLD